MRELVVVEDPGGAQLAELLEQRDALRIREVEASLLLRVGDRDRDGSAGGVRAPLPSAGAALAVVVSSAGSTISPAAGLRAIPRMSSSAPR